MIASLEGHVDIVKTLIGAKAQINIQDEVWLTAPTTRKHTPQHIIIIHNATILGELTVCLCPQNGFTALHMAAQEGKVDVVRLLIEAKAHINIQVKVRHV